MTLNNRKDGGIRYRYHAAACLALLLMMGSGSIVNLIFGAL